MILYRKVSEVSDYLPNRTSNHQTLHTQSHLHVHVPGVAITSMHTTKLDRFDEIEKRGKRKFESELLETVCQTLQEIIIY